MRKDGKRKEPPNKQEEMKHKNEKQRLQKNE